MPLIPEKGGYGPMVLAGSPVELVTFVVLALIRAIAVVSGLGSRHPIERVTV